MTVSNSWWGIFAIAPVKSEDFCIIKKERKHSQF